MPHSTEPQWQRRPFEKSCTCPSDFPVLQIVLPLRLAALLQTTDPIAVFLWPPGPVPQGLALGDRCLAFRGAGKDTDRAVVAACGEIAIGQSKTFQTHAA
jgi:hypothetical protein